MTQTSHSRLGIAALLVLGSALLFAASAAAQDVNFKCRQTINKAFAKHIATVVKAYQKCNDGFVKAQEGHCSAHPQRSCTSDANCASCVGGSNANASCTVASQCPGGTCTIPGGACISENRKCFLTGGLSNEIGTNTLTAVGMADAAMADTASSTLGSVFCVAPTGSAAVNSVVGLPGPGRTTIKGAASFYP